MYLSCVVGISNDGPNDGTNDGLNDGPNNLVE